MQKNTSRTTWIIIGTIAAILYGGFYIMIFVLLPLGADEQEKRDYGYIRLPNSYLISKINATSRFLLHTSIDASTNLSVHETVVGFDIDALAWGSRYVFYHVSKKQTSQGPYPGNRNFGILDTVTGKKNSFETLDEAKKELETIGAGSLTLQSVKDFFPETKSSSHALTLD